MSSEEKVPIFWRIFGGGVVSAVVLIILFVLNRFVSDVQATRTDLSQQIKAVAEQDKESTKDLTESIKTITEKHEVTLKELAKDFKGLSEKAQVLEKNAAESKAKVVAAEKLIVDLRQDHKDQQKTIAELSKTVTDLKAKLTSKSNGK